MWIFLRSRCVEVRMNLSHISYGIIEDFLDDVITRTWKLWDVDKSQLTSLTRVKNNWSHYHLSTTLEEVAYMSTV